MAVMHSYSSVRSPRWSNRDHSAVDCLVKFDHLIEEVPFTASRDDVESHGREIFVRCFRGDFGKIDEYVPSGDELYEINMDVSGDIKRYQEYLDDANKGNECGTERGTVLVWSSIIEELLEALLKAYLADIDKNDAKELYESNGPLSTFSSKVLMAKSLGLITKQEASALNLVRKIRNDFAHRVGQTLTKSPHKERCHQLSVMTLGEPMMLEPRHWYTIGCGRLLIFLWRRIGEAKNQKRQLLADAVPLKERGN